MQILEYKKPSVYDDDIGGVMLRTELVLDGKQYLISEVRSERLNETMVFRVTEERIQWSNVGGLIFNDTDEAMRWLLAN